MDSTCYWCLLPEIVVLEGKGLEKKKKKRWRQQQLDPPESRRCDECGAN